MSKVRMFGDESPEDQREEKPASPRTTIVGGRPPETGDGLPPVPTGIESLLRLANLDESFRAILLERRGEAAAAAGVELTSSERAILGAIPESQIAEMSARLPPPPPQRRTFLRQAAASAVVALGGAALTACEGCRPVHNQMQTDGGAAPDEPPVRPERNQMETTGSAAPDEPPPPPPADAGAPPPRPQEAMPPTGHAPDIPPAPPRVDDHNVPIGGAVAEPPPQRPRPQVSRGIRPDVPRTRGHAADVPSPGPFGNEKK